MQFGINTLLWTAAFDSSHLDLLPGIKEAGFDGVEIARFDFKEFPAAKIRRAIEANDLGCTFCSALTGGVTLASANNKDAIAFLEDGIRTAADLGAAVFVGPFCSPVGYLPGRRRSADEWQYAIDGLRSLIPTLERNGVTLAMEALNRFETFFLNTSFDAKALCEAVGHPAVGILFDTFHANIEEKSIAEGLRTIGSRLKHVHACENDRGIPGSGHVAWQELRDGMRELDYDGWIVIESFGFAIKEIAAAACIWRDLARTPEDIAFEGLKFLKDLVRSE
jgi:D-psicose/D-tagatose/L-ribulose 3-epimerase